MHTSRLQVPSKHPMGPVSVLGCPGGAAAHNNWSFYLPLQLQERRSAVSRQACHAVSALAQACGTTFEPLAVHLLPTLFKTLAMGIQVGGR